MRSGLSPDRLKTTTELIDEIEAQNARSRVVCYKAVTVKGRDCWISLLEVRSAENHIVDLEGVTGHAKNRDLVVGSLAEALCNVGRFDPLPSDITPVAEPTTDTGRLLVANAHEWLVLLYNGAGFRPEHQTAMRVAALFVIGGGKLNTSQTLRVAKLLSRHQRFLPLNNAPMQLTSGTENATNKSQRGQ